MEDRGFSGLRYRDWMRACEKLGLTTDSSKGKGNHCKVCHPSTGKCFTLQKHIHRFISVRYFKKLLEWGFKEEDIWRALKRS
jgi:hypothetical protein